MAEQHFEVLVAGAGPAGLAAALAASSSGKQTGLLDENGCPGGQIYRATKGEPSAEMRKQIRDLQANGVAILGGTTVIDAPAPGTLIGISPAGPATFGYDRLILATGARELFLPFPGWTLPNVMGVGGLQAMVKSGMQIAGKRVVISGSGPLLLAVAAYLRKHGARVLAIAEQASAASLARFTAHLIRACPSKLGQGAVLSFGAGRLLQCGSWVESAGGNSQLEAVKLNRSPGQTQCDYLACAFGFVPNLELPILLDCALDQGFVKVDQWQETSLPGVFCAGEPTGIGGVELSVVEGEIAGYAAIGQRYRAAALCAERSRRRLFAREMARAFALRPEIKALATTDTVVCRCEDVRFGQLSNWESGRAAKLHTRCGMGSCQGRICGPATQELFGWEHGTVRPPLTPAPLCGLEACGTNAEKLNEGKMD